MSRLVLLAATFLIMLMRMRMRMQLMMIANTNTLQLEIGADKQQRKEHTIWIFWLTI